MEETAKIETLSQEVATLREKLEKQEKLASLGLLSAGIAHEVQNPLNFVINFSKLSGKLLKDLTEIVDDCANSLDEDDAIDMKEIASDLKENLQKIQEHGERAISVIRGILLQSRGKAGEFLPTDISHLVHEYVWLSYHAMRAGDSNFNISIHEEYQEQLPKVFVVPQDISRAILNAMNNACYAVKERSTEGDDKYQPKINVKVSMTQGAQGMESLKIEIEDNGIGMSGEVQSRIFDNFYTTKPIGHGTGLGMGIISRIIKETHKGELLIDSSENVGTKLTFIIPVKVSK